MGWAERGRWLGEWLYVAVIFGWTLLIETRDGGKVAMHYDPEAANYAVPVIPGARKTALGPPLIVVKCGPFTWYFDGNSYPGI